MVFISQECVIDLIEIMIKWGQEIKAMKDLKTIKFRDIEWWLRVAYEHKMEGDAVYCDCENFDHNCKCIEKLISKLIDAVDVNNEIAKYFLGANCKGNFSEKAEKIREILADKSQFEILIQTHFGSEMEPYDLKFQVGNKANVDKIMAFIEAEGVKS